MKEKLGAYAPYGAYIQPIERPEAECIAGITSMLLTEIVRNCMKDRSFRHSNHSAWSNALDCLAVCDVAGENPGTMDTRGENWEKSKMSWRLRKVSNIFVIIVLREVGGE